ncbi:metal ABC transporter solute-binding protein, Zn/Mn family [Fluviicola sp.]|jgi:manganese/zinc/iron transport system substrate-binding protein|uniref:metal ABC transporter solute-binding protein, Zn/Mn family n=1 Tax=Fluviicola sp. TaxID=1917219 RepID=UPI00282DB750|nr:zinc ABC transporter substrate-binding protein [Fluviicola sp.]MDR0802156.1 zinc ABC transporter substrate-binding protein [Fluviicola sp.]
MRSFICLMTGLFLLLGCRIRQREENEKLIVCSTSVIADCVYQVVGDRLIVKSLMGPGVDPHTYNPRPSDVGLLNDARLVVYTGFHLEGKMAELFGRLSERKAVVSFQTAFPRKKILYTDRITADPHVWFDTGSWIRAMNEVVDKLIKLYPQYELEFHENFYRFSQKVEAWTAKLRSELAEIPKERRILITSHDAFHYFGRTFGIEVKALQGVSTSQEPGVRDVVDLVNFIVEHQIKAIFVENSVSPKALNSVLNSVKRKGSHVKIGGTLFSDALGSAGSGADTYIGMITHNIRSIKAGLK